MPTELALPADFASCPHDRGPGIAVCLRCRAESNARAATARRRLVTRLGMGGIAALGIVAVTGSGLPARLQLGLRAPAASAPAPAPSESFQVTSAVAAEPARATAAVAAPVATPVAAPLAPLVGEGRTAMPQGMYAERAGDSVAVHFDTPMLRTRRHDKFEQVVRATLPTLYGAPADSALAAVNVGELAAGGDLTHVLPTAGVPLPAREGWAITLWPQTRPGRDGPLVVGYRVSLARAQ